MGRSAHLRTLPLGRRLPRTPLTITTSGLSSTTVRTNTPGGASPTTLSLPSLTTTSTTSAPSVPTTTSGLRTSATTRPVRLMPTAAPLPLRPPLVTTTAARDTARMLTTRTPLKTRALKSGARPRTNGMPMVGIRTSKRPSPSTPLKPRPTMPSPTMSGTTKMPTNGVPRSGAATKMSMDNLPTARRPPLTSGPAPIKVTVVTPMSPRTGRVPPEVTLHLAVLPMTPNGPTRSTVLIPTPGGASLTTPSLPGLTTAPSTAGPSMLVMISGLRTTTATPMTILRVTATVKAARAFATLPPDRVPRACATRTVTITAPTVATVATAPATARRALSTVRKSPTWATTKLPLKEEPRRKAARAISSPSPSTTLTSTLATASLTTSSRPTSTTTSSTLARFAPTTTNGPRTAASAPTVTPTATPRPLPLNRNSLRSRGLPTSLSTLTAATVAGDQLHVSHVY